MWPRRDGLIYIATSNDARAHIALEAIGLGELNPTPEYATNTARMQARDRISPESPLHLLHSIICPPLYVPVISAASPLISLSSPPAEARGAQAPD